MFDRLRQTIWYNKHGFANSYEYNKAMGQELQRIIFGGNDMEWNEEAENQAYAELFAKKHELKDYPPYLDREKPTNKKLEDSNVNHPDHYIHNGIETIDVIKAWCKTGFTGYLEGNIIKYISRWKDKNGLEDLKKAQWYLNRLIEEMEEIKHDS